MIVASDISEIPPNLRDMLPDMSERSIIAFPIWDKSGLLGFIGVSDCRQRRWDAEEIMILWNLSTMVADRVKSGIISAGNDRSNSSILGMLSHTMHKIVRRIS